MFYYPQLFHTPKFSYGSHLYVGAIQIETFCLKSLEKWTEGRDSSILTVIAGVDIGKRGKWAIEIKKENFVTF